MIAFLIFSGIGLFAWAIKVKNSIDKRNFDRTNQYGVREFENWNDVQNHRLKQVGSEFGGSILMILAFVFWGIAIYLAIS